MSSRGEGNRPLERSARAPRSDFGSLPWSRSTTEATCEACAATSAFQRAASSAFTETEVLYNDEPLTFASTIPDFTCRSMTEPLRAYVRPRGRRFEKSAYASRFWHHDLPQNDVAIARPSMTTGERVCPPFFAATDCFTASARRRATGTYGFHCLYIGVLQRYESRRERDRRLHRREPKYVWLDKALPHAHARRALGCEGVIALCSSDLYVAVDVTGATPRLTCNHAPRRP